MKVIITCMPFQSNSRPTCVSAEHFVLTCPSLDKRWAVTIYLGTKYVSQAGELRQKYFGFKSFKKLSLTYTDSIVVPVNAMTAYG
jgi:hypothetical protein